MKVLVAGGGSGGHITPVLAVLEALEKKSEKLEVQYVGSKDGIENKIISNTQIPFVSIEAGKVRRYSKSTLLSLLSPKTFLENSKDISKVIKGVASSIKIIKNFKPDIIFMKGGYVSFPVGIAAKILGYPFCIHESDTIPGITNKILSKWAANIFVSYPKENFKGIFEENRLIYSGTPIREDVLKGDREKGYEKFKFNKDRKTILVIGGSQGARALNLAVEGALEDLLYDYQIIHITGEADFDKCDYKASTLSADIKSRYKVYDFLSSDLKDAYAISDLIISRAGNNVLTEISALKKPSILIPHPWGNNHQYKNALIFSRVGAAYLLEEERLSPISLRRTVNHLLGNKEELEYMSSKVGNLFKADASDVIARRLIKISQERKRKEKDVQRKKEQKVQDKG